MAGRLYIDAVQRQSIPADPEIMAYLRLHQPTEAATGSQEALPSQHNSQAAGPQGQAATRQKPKPVIKRQKSSQGPAVSHFDILTLWKSLCVLLAWVLIHGIPLYML